MLIDSLGTIFILFFFIFTLGILFSYIIQLPLRLIISKHVSSFFIIRFEDDYPSVSWKENLFLLFYLLISAYSASVLMQPIMNFWKKYYSVLLYNIPVISIILFLFIILICFYYIAFLPRTLQKDLSNTLLSFQLRQGFILFLQLLSFIVLVSFFLLLFFSIAYLINFLYLEDGIFLYSNYYIIIYTLGIYQGMLFFWFFTRWELIRRVYKVILPYILFLLLLLQLTIFIGYLEDRNFLGSLFDIYDSSLAMFIIFISLALLIISFIILSFLHMQKKYKTYQIVIILHIVLVILFATMFSHSILSYNYKVSSSNLDTLSEQDLWSYNIDSIFKRALDTNQLILLYFNADWCSPCKKMNKELFSSTVFQDIVRQHSLLLLKIDTTDEELLTAKEKKFQSTYMAELLPILIILDQSGKALWREEGYFGKKKMLKSITNFFDEYSKNKLSNNE